MLEKIVTQTAHCIKLNSWRIIKTRERWICNRHWISRSNDENWAIKLWENKKIEYQKGALEWSLSKQVKINDLGSNAVASPSNKWNKK